MLYSSPVILLFADDALGHPEAYLILQNITSPIDNDATVHSETITDERRFSLVRSP